jgi:hypothetical protein
VVWYVRRGKGKRIRIRAEYGTPDFDAEYQAALAGVPRAQNTTTVGSLAWLIERYRETTAWTDLSLATRRNHENHFRRVLESAGDKPYRNITQAAIVAGKDRRAKTPAQARNFLDAMRGLFKWAKQAQHVTIDPTAGITNPKRKRGPGFPVWTGTNLIAITSDGRSAPRSAFGLTFYYIPVAAGVMLFVLGVSTSATAWRLSEQRKARARSASRFRSCRSYRKRSTSARLAISLSSLARMASP